MLAPTSNGASIQKQFIRFDVHTVRKYAPYEL